MKAIRYSLMIIMILITIALTAYIGLYLLLFNGIMQVVNAVKMTPISFSEILLGTASILGSCLISLIIFWVGMVFVAAAHKFTKDP